MNTIQTNFADLIHWLQSNNQLSSQQADSLINANQAERLLPANNSVDRAWYIKLFIGLSAWIAAIFLIAGVSGLAFIADGITMAIAGLVLLGAALTLKWMRRQSIFWGQFAFALSLTGQGLFFGGITQIILDNFRYWEQSAVSQIALIVIATQILLFFIFPDTVHRLLSVIFASLAGILLIGNELVDWTLPSQQMNKLLGTLPSFLLMLFALGLFWVWQRRTKFFASRWHELHAPLGYGLAIVMFFVAISALFIDDIVGINTRLLWLASIGLALLLAHLGMQVVDEFSGEFGQPLLMKLSIIIAIALLLIPLHETPGIWAALLALALSFQQNGRLLLGLASLFLLFFIGFYYYSLDITLLNKSYALIGSGLLLLLIRFAGGRLLGQHSDSGQPPAMSSATGDVSI